VTVWMLGIVGSYLTWQLSSSFHNSNAARPFGLGGGAGRGGPAEQRVCALLCCEVGGGCE